MRNTLHIVNSVTPTASPTMFFAHIYTFIVIWHIVFSTQAPHQKTYLNKQTIWCPIFAEHWMYISVLSSSTTDLFHLPPAFCIYLLSISLLLCVWTQSSDYWLAFREGFTWIFTLIVCHKHLFLLCYICAKVPPENSQPSPPPKHCPLSVASFSSTMPATSPHAFKLELICI